jgi:arabinogalactan oligomer/maltooligosaccharide transport system permease protein
MKKKMNLRLDLVRLIPVCALGMAITLLLPWLHTVQTLGAVTHNGLDLVKSQNLLHMTPLTAAGVAAILLSVIALLKPSKALLIAVAAALSACVLSGVYALLTLKRAADASGLLTQAFLMRDLGPGLWLYLILAVVGLFLTLRAMREPIEYIVLTVMASVWLLPIVWLVLTAFRQESGAYTPYIMPKGYTWNNFTRLFTETAQFSFPRWYLNTLVVAVFTCVFTTAMVLMISYTFSRLRFPARKKLMNIGLILGMFPGFMSMIAVYHILKAIGLAKSLVSLVMVYTGGGILNYFIAKGFFDTIPHSLDEAATIDGASKNLVFWKIILPSSTPIVVYTAITAFIAPWVDFIFVSVIMKDEYQNYTVALGLFRMLEREHIYEYFTRFCAGAVLVAIPITLLFINIQKFYVEGVTGGAVKG